MSKEIKVTRVMNAQAAGVTDVSSEVIDMQGFDGVQFVTLFGAIDAGAVTSVKAQEAEDSSFSTAYDIEGSKISVADTDDNKAVILDIYKPKRRYVRLVVSRDTANAVIDGAIAFQYDTGKYPVSHDSTVASSELHVNPDEGTA